MAPIEQYFQKLSRYHYMLFFFIFLSKIPMFWHVLNMIFLAPPVNFYCKDNMNAYNSNLSSVTNVCPCKTVEWDRTTFLKTIVSKYSLYCDKKWQISFSQSMTFTGMLFGSLTFGFLSDRYGRLLTFTISTTIIAVVGCLISAMTDLIGYICMRFFEGFAVGGAIVTGYVLLVEYCSTKHRETVTALYHIPINLSHITLSGVSYLLRNSDQFQLAISIPLFLFMFLICILYESPKWLLDNGKTEKAIATMHKIFKFNKHEHPDFGDELQTYQDSKTNQGVRKMKFWHIFQHRKLSLNLACMSVIYFVCGAGYYGVSQYIGKMSGDIHINVAISGSLLLPGTIASVFLLKLLGRRTFLMATNLLSGIFMLIIFIIPEKYLIWRVVIACICNCFFFMSFIIVFLYGVELFPTSIRNSVLGFLSFLSRLGQVVAPQINALSHTTAEIFFGVSAIVGAILCYPLPETKDAELPSTLEDAKTFVRKSVTMRRASANPDAVQ